MNVQLTRTNTRREQGGTYSLLLQERDEYMKGFAFKIIFVISILAFLVLGLTYYRHVKEGNHELVITNYSPNEVAAVSPNPPITSKSDQSSNTLMESDDFVDIEPDPTIVPINKTLNLTYVWDYKPVNGLSKPVVLQNQVINKAPLSILDNHTGKVIWETSHYPDDYVVEDDKIIFCEGSYVLAVDVSTGVEKWSFEMGQDTISTPNVHGNVAYVSSGDGSIYGLDLLTGEKRFEYITEEGPSPEGTISSPVIIGDILFYISPSNTLYEIDIRSGEQIWTKKKAASAGVIDFVTFNNKLAWLTENGIFTIMDIKSKRTSVKILINLEEGEGIYDGFYEHDGILYMFSDKMIIAMSETDEEIVKMFNLNNTDRSEERIADISVHDQSLWFVTNKCLYSLELSDINGKNLTRYSNQFVGEDTQRSIGSLEFNENVLFVITSDSKLSKYLIK